MILWKIEYIRPPYIHNNDEIVFRRHMCEWLLPQSLASHLKYNPRHLPVVRKEPDNEYYYLRMSIRRALDGYRALRTYLPPSSFND